MMPGAGGGSFPCWATRLALPLAFIGCIRPRYVYSPMRVSGAEISGATAASYEIPRESPRGTVRVAVVGIVALDGEAAPDAGSSQAVHLSIVVSNRSEEVWSVVPTEQRIEVSSDDEDETLRPVAARPVGILVLPGVTRRMDFYFWLPRELEDPSEVPGLNAIWVVRTRDALVTHRTSFERFRSGVAPTPVRLLP